MKVRVKAGMPDGFFGFTNNAAGVGIRRRCGESGADGEESKPGDEFELVDLMTGPDSKRVVAVKAVDTFSDKWMDYYDPKSKEWKDHPPGWKPKEIPKATNAGLTL